MLLNLDRFKPNVSSPENNPSNITEITSISRPIEINAKYLTPELELQVRTKILNLKDTLCGSGEITKIYPESIAIGECTCSNRGSVFFSTTFKADVYSHKEGDVLDISVYAVSNYGIFGTTGPSRIFVPKNYINSYFYYDSDTNSYKSKSEITKTKVFETTSKKRSGSKEPTKLHLVIKQGSDVRIKIMAVRSSTQQLFMIGSMLENYLGLLSTC